MDTTHYNFDQELERRGTNSLKWEYFLESDAAGRRLPTDAAFGEDRMLPMWVADMDFPAPQPVVEAVLRRAAHPIYGYAMPDPDYYAAVSDWMRRRHGWTVDPDWIVVSPGVVPALYMLVRAFCRPGDKVLIQPPVYPPFFSAVVHNDAVVAANPLVNDGGRYRMDFADLEAKLADPAVKLAILCSPHNPVGRVWTAEELRRFGELCLAHGVVVVADEIHCDLTLPGHRFMPFASLGDDLAQHTVVCTAPSKTFNLAGLKTANLIVPNPELRQQVVHAYVRTGFFGANPIGLAAARAAYTEGEAWLDQVLAYLDGNRRALEAFVAERLPQIRVTPLEGTYLAWLDCRGLGLDPAALKRLWVEAARVYPEMGTSFGAEGAGFVRLNIACPRPLLLEALARLEAAVNGRQG